MKILTRVLFVVLILVASSAIINFVTSRPAPWIDIARREAKFRSADDEKFRSFLNSGTKAMQNKQYSEALSNFQEAERSIAELSDDQYASLKNGRLQIANAYEASGSDSETEGVYKILAASAIQAGRTDLQFHRVDAALAALHDAEQFSDHLTQTRQASLLEARGVIVDCLRQMQRYPEAAETTQRMIDDLRTYADEYDPAIASKYLELAQTYSLEKDWNGEEQALLKASEACDLRVAHFSGLAGAGQSLVDAVSYRVYAQYWLADAYSHDNKVELALSTADDLFNYIQEHSLPAPPYTFNQKGVANLAFRIASLTNRQDAIELWRQRLK